MFRLNENPYNFDWMIFLLCDLIDEFLPNEQFGHWRGTYQYV